MANPQTETQAGATATAEAGEFASLLNKEFKPKTDQARDAVVQAVRTLAEQALVNTQIISADAYKTIESIIARAGSQAVRAGQRDHASPRLPAARGRMARSALSRQQHRNR